MRRAGAEGVLRRTGTSTGQCSDVDRGVHLSRSSGPLDLISRGGVGVCEGVVVGLRFPGFRQHFVWRQTKWVALTLPPNLPPLLPLPHELADAALAATEVVTEL